MGPTMLLKRQTHLLSVLDALGGRVSNLDFQKLLFLFCQEAAPAPYEFVPYRFGAFSFTSYADRRKLAERGILAADDNSWTLTPDGYRIAGVHRSLSATTFARAHAGLRGDDLVADTYRRFPFYATRSEIASRLLRRDAHALARIDQMRQLPRPGLLTIGYEGLSLEAYLNRLLRAGVSVLCDVRRNPVSRKYGFSRRTLSHGCEGVGIRYEHLPELGIDSIERQSLNSQSDYDALFDRYERDTLPLRHAAVATIARWINAGNAVALTCYEQMPSQCHRHCVAEAVERDIPTTTTQHL